MNSNTITNPRLIKGILTELQQFDQGILLDDYGYVPSISFGVSNEISGTYTLLLPIKETFTGEISASFWLGKNYYKCTLHCVSEGVFFPPIEIQSINRRTKTRFEVSDFSPSTIFSVLTTHSEKLFSRVQNINSEFIAITTSKPGDTLVPGTVGQLNTYFEGNLAGVHHVICDSFHKNADSDYKILLRVVSDTHLSERSNSRGQPLRPITFNLYWPNTDGFSILVELTEMSGLGLSGQFITPLSELFPVGTIFQERASKARIRLAWCADGRAGFSFDVCEPRLREELFSYLGSRSSPGGHTSARLKAKVALSLLTKAGLLKSERAISYSNADKREIFLYRSGASNRWLSQDPTSESYLSFLRISNDSWLIQELGSVTDEKDVGRSLILEGIRRFQASRHEALSPRNSIVGIYDVTSKFNLNFWRKELLNYLTSPPLYSNVILGSIKNKIKRKAKSGNSSLHRVRAEEWLDIYSQVEEPLEEDLNYALGISASDFLPRLLADVILADSKLLEREVFAVRSNGKTLGFLIKLGLPPLANATSLVENLYIIPTCKDRSVLMDAIFIKDCEALTGVEDICLISSNQNDEIILKQLMPEFAPRQFELALFRTYSFRGPS